jgi:hypothetical protein
VIEMPVVQLRRSTQWNFARAALGCAVGVMVLGAAPLRAQDATPEEKILDGIMTSIGLTRGGPTIDYRERSPLVIPPNSNLPPPQTSAVTNPNWPVEPEVREAKALAAANKDDGRTSSQKMDDAMRPLLRSEIDKGRTSKKQNNPRGDESGMRPSSWSELGYKGGIFGNIFKKDDPVQGATFTAEPPRTSLVEPPTGYQTPSPNQPYAVSKDRYIPKAIDYYGERKYEK